MNGKKARALNKILDTACTFAFFAPVMLVVYSYIGRECVRYTVKNVRVRLSR